jgi:hypothetical protein
MGLFDLPAPLFALIDGVLAGALPSWLRLVAWGVAGGAVSMWLYRLLSPQRKIAEIKAAALDARKAMIRHDGDFADVGALARRSLGLSLHHLLLTLVPVLAASLPVLALMVWLSNHHGHALPAPGTPVELTAWPAGGGAPEALAVAWPAPGQTATVRDGTGARVLTLPLPAAVPVKHRWRWWNGLIGNPAGYLPDDAAYDWVDVDLPARDHLGAGPDWLRSWAAAFFAAMVAASLAIKAAFRIQ